MHIPKSDQVPTSDVEHDDIIYPASIPFVLVHLTCIAAIWTGITWQAVAIGFGLYWLRIFAIGAGYHRYFSHRAYATGRIAQFVLAAVAQSTAQRSVCGGPPSTAIIICIPTPSKMSTRPAIRASCTAMWDGFSPSNMTPPTS